MLKISWNWLRANKHLDGYQVFRKLYSFIALQSMECLPQIKHGNGHKKPIIKLNCN